MEIIITSNNMWVCMTIGVQISVCMCQRVHFKAFVLKLLVSMTVRRAWGKKRGRTERWWHGESVREESRVFLLDRALGWKKLTPWLQLLTWYLAFHSILPVLYISLSSFFLSCYRITAWVLVQGVWDKGTFLLSVGFCCGTIYLIYMAWGQN